MEHLSNPQLPVDAAAVAAVAVGDAVVVGSCDHHVTQMVERLLQQQQQQMGVDGDPSGKAWGRDSWHQAWADPSSAFRVFLCGRTWEDRGRDMHQGCLQTAGGVLRLQQHSMCFHRPGGGGHVLLPT